MGPYKLLKICSFGGKEWDVLFFVVSVLRRFSLVQTNQLIEGISGEYYGNFLPISCFFVGQLWKLQAIGKMRRWK